MTALRRQLRRAGKEMSVAVHISIINEDTMKVTATDRALDTSERRAMDVLDGISH